MFLTGVLIAVTLLTFSEAADVSLAISGRVNFTESTAQIKCKVAKIPDPATSLLILLNIERVTSDATKAIASQRVSGVVVPPDVNGTKAAGSLNSVDGAKLDVTVPVTVSDEESEDDAAGEATFQCRFGYLDMSEFKFVVVNQTVTVSLVKPVEPTIPPPVELEPGDCTCELVRAEVQALRETLLAENAALKKKLKAYDETCRVSFTARLKGRKDTMFRSNHHVIFDSVLTNKGEAYNETTGSFTAPCNGQYYFRLSMRTQQEFDSGYVDGAIEVDDVEMARTSVFTSEAMDHYDQASNGLVLTLTEGQQVKVRIHTNSKGRIYGEGFSIFSGFFINP